MLALQPAPWWLWLWPDEAWQVAWKRLWQRLRAWVTTLAQGYTLLR